MILLDKLFSAVQEVEDFVNMNISVYKDVVWSYYDNELAVNTDGDEDSLFTRDGNTYSYEVKYATESDDGYVLFTDADNGCGYTETIMVKACEQRE